MWNIYKYRFCLFGKQERLVNFILNTAISIRPYCYRTVVCSKRDQSYLVVLRPSNQYWVCNSYIQLYYYYIPDLHTDSVGFEHGHLRNTNRNVTTYFLRVKKMFLLNSQYLVINKPNVLYLYNIIYTFLWHFNVTRKIAVKSSDKNSAHSHWCPRRETS